MVEDTKISIGGISSNEIQNTDWKIKFKKKFCICYQNRNFKVSPKLKKIYENHVALKLPAVGLLEYISAFSVLIQHAQDPGFDRQHTLPEQSGPCLQSQHFLVGAGPGLQGHPCLQERFEDSQSNVSYVKVFLKRKQTKHEKE